MGTAKAFACRGGCVGWGGGDEERHGDRELGVLVSGGGRVEPTWVQGPSGRVRDGFAK